MYTLSTFSTITTYDPIQLPIAYMSPPNLTHLPHTLSHSHTEALVGLLIS